MPQESRITGNVRVEERVKGRMWVAAFVQGDGRKDTTNPWTGLGASVKSADQARRDRLACS
ncbi:MAG: hypothetical protein JWQ48_33 [Conexibacter sp.]|jgi:hypothetical protein|nr:hypothetical protein [Conexibacter sp.]